MEKNEAARQVLQALTKAGRILLISHVSPDGDTLGSTLALAHRLERMGKQVSCMCRHAVPSKLAFLPGAETFLQPGMPVFTCDLAVAVDVSADYRMDECAPYYEAAADTAVIDHHGTNEGFGRVNWIESGAPATGVLIWRLLSMMELPLDEEEMLCLYAAVSTDTGNFIYESTDAEAFEMMADLKHRGFRQEKAARRLFREKEQGFLLLLKQALSTLHFAADGRIAGVSVSFRDMSAIPNAESYTDGIVDYPSDAEGVKLAYFARELQDGSVKFSLRAKDGYRVDELAKALGGGGHAGAAGVTVSGKAPEEACALIETEMMKQLEEHE